jgi:predicted O-methyltransferase YrrM
MSDARELPQDYPTYQFMFFPRQLRFLLDCLDRTMSIAGSVVEVGCAYGLTTTFLYEYLRDSGCAKPYVCIDTFSGFSNADIEYERTVRGKRAAYKAFRVNHPDWLRQALARRHINDVEIIQGDICELDASRLPEEIAFCLLDVDLYRPVKAGLEKIYPRLAPGGIIVVDDCWTVDRHMWVEGYSDMYDGALEAYREFVTHRGLAPRLVEAKLGVIQKPIAT